MPRAALVLCATTVAISAVCGRREAHVMHTRYLIVASLSEPHINRNELRKLDIYTCIWYVGLFLSYSVRPAQCWSFRIPYYMLF